MKHVNMQRFSRLSSHLAPWLCLVLGWMQAAIWYGAEAPPWIRTVSPVLAAGSVGASQLEQPDANYFLVGRFTVLIYLLWGLSGLGRSSGHRWLDRLRWATFSTALLGDVLAYWLSHSFGPQIRELGFWHLEVPALSLGLLLTTAVGILEYSRGSRTLLTKLQLATLPMVGISMLGLRYMPHGLLLPMLVISWASRRSSDAPLLSLDHTPYKAALMAITVPAVALLIALPYRPIRITGPSANPNLDYTLPEKTDGLTLHVFNTGMNRMSGLLVGPQPPWRSVPAFVIEHPKHGLVVFDCGLSDAVAKSGESAMAWPVSWLMESRGRPDMTLPAQMQREQLALDHVTHVIISHAHEDHLGAAPYFPDAVFHFNGDPALLRKNGFEPQVMKLSSGLPHPPTGDTVDLFGDGSLRLIAAPGHTTEDIMLFVGLPEGPVLLSGDAVVHRDWLDSDDVERIAEAPIRAAKVRNHVRGLLRRHPDVILFPGHDLGHLETLPARDDIVVHSGPGMAPQAISSARIP